MKKLVSSIVVAVLASACGPLPCQQLKCDACSDKYKKQACEILVNGKVQSLCEKALDKPDYASCQ
jgi:hypothetical protein